MSRPVAFGGRRKPAAAVISPEAIGPKSLSLNKDPRFLAIIEEGRAQIRAGEILSLEEMKKAVLR